VQKGQEHGPGLIGISIMHRRFSFGISRLDLETATFRITAVPVITATPACFSLGEKRFRAGMPLAARTAAWLWTGGTPPLLSVLGGLVSLGSDAGHAEKPRPGDRCRAARRAARPAHDVYVRTSTTACA
jgi:hypothetical protein